MNRISKFASLFTCALVLVFAGHALTGCSIASKNLEKYEAKKKAKEAELEAKKADLDKKLADRASVVYAIKDIPKGEKISQESMEEKKIKKDFVPENALTSASEAEGRLAKEKISAGQIIGKDQVASTEAENTAE